MLFSLVSLLFALPLVLAASIHTPHDSHDDHAHEINQALPGTWYQDPDHPVHSLFKRAPGDGTDYPAVGTPRTCSTASPTFYNANTIAQNGPKVFLMCLPTLPICLQSGLRPSTPRWQLGRFQTSPSRPTHHKPIRRTPKVSIDRKSVV